MEKTKAATKPENLNWFVSLANPSVPSTSAVFTPSFDLESGETNALPNTRWLTE